MRDLLKAGLSGAQAEASGEPRATVADIAEKIKALKASQVIEAAPQHTGTRRVSAEEPVTARIRRRAETLAAADPSLVIDAAAAPGDPSSVPGADDGKADHAGIDGSNKWTEQAHSPRKTLELHGDEPGYGR